MTEVRNTHALNPHVNVPETRSPAMPRTPPPRPLPRSRPRPGRGRLVAFAACVGTALLVPTTLVANGGTLRLANVEMGAYRVSVFTDPTPVRPDSLDVSVLVLREGEPGVAEGVEVRVRAEIVEYEGDGPPPPVASTGWLPATREQADDPRYRSAKFALGAEGRWRVTVAVRGEGGEGEAAFEVRARPRGLLGHPLVIVALALLPLAGAAWWVLRDDA